MKSLRCAFPLILVILILLAPVSTPAAAQQIVTDLEVWFIRSMDTSLPAVEYRDAHGNTVASYGLGTDSMNWPTQGGGLLAGQAYGTESIPIFSPLQREIAFHPAAGIQPSTEDRWHNVSQVAPNPDGNRLAYGVMLQHSDWEKPSTSSIYLATPGQPDQLLLQEDKESFLAVVPLGWSADGNRLLLHEMPQGIGGYILFWQYQNVRAYDLNTGTMQPLGNLDGYSGDLQYTATVKTNDFGPVALELLQTATGQIFTYPLPALGEQPRVGGGAFFSPGGTQVAYQVARGTPEQEKYWTIVVNLTTGESRVVLEDESTGYEVRYANIGGWVNENTLIVGSQWSGQSAVVDVTTGALVYEASGAFLGVIPGATETSVFAPSGLAYAQCPGAPPSRLLPDTRGRITLTNGTATNVRMDPGINAEKVASLPEGETFYVTSGPICKDGYAWWALNFDSGTTTYGFVAEGDFNDYWLEPWQ